MQFLRRFILTHRRIVCRGCGKPVFSFTWLVNRGCFVRVTLILQLPWFRCFTLLSAVRDLCLSPCLKLNERWQITLSEALPHRGMVIESGFFLRLAVFTIHQHPSLSKFQCTRANPCQLNSRTIHFFKIFISKKYVWKHLALFFFKIV